MNQLSWRKIFLPLPVSGKDDDVEGNVDRRREPLNGEGEDGVAFAGEVAQRIDAKLKVEVFFQ